MNVYDFDNTIYDGESFIDCFKTLLKRDLSLLKFAPAVAIGAVQYKLGKIDVQQMVDKYSVFFEEYLGAIPDLNAEVTSFWDKNMKKIKPFYRELQRPDDMVVSASPDFMIAEICRRLGIGAFIASEIDPETKSIRRMCFREEKVKMFTERFPGVRIDSFYTDSINDTPMIELAEKAFMVKGSKIEQIK